MSMLNFEYMDPELVRLLLAKVPAYLPQSGN